MKKGAFLRILEFVCRLGLGALFIYSALSKISDPDNFAHSVMRYRVLPDFAIGLFSLTMPMLELLVGLAMLFTKWLRESALFVTGMMAMFIVALAQALARGLEISCGCFGVPSVGGREEILMALARDVVLIVPAVWLMFRPNARIAPLERMSKGWRIACLCGFGALLAAWFANDMYVSGVFSSSLSSKVEDAVAPVQVVPPPKVEADVEQGEDAPPPKEEVAVVQGRKSRKPKLVVSSGPIRPGEWNTDFLGVLAKAEQEQRPMVLMQVSNGCSYCRRLEECASGEIFRLWREDRAPLMAFVRAGTRLSSRKNSKASGDFVHRIDKDLKLPYVCAYWPQGGVTNRIAFSGRRGGMGGRKDKLLVVELMSALDRAFGDKLTAGRKSLEEIVKAAVVRISARAEGDGGTVTMTPANGLLTDGGRVVLAAQPKEGYAFLDWRYPDGSLADLESDMTVYVSMPAGCYTARFKNRAQCLPPLIISPTEAFIRVKVKDGFSHEVRVDESCRPVRFLIKRPVAGVEIDPVTGVLTGEISEAATNIVEIAVIGSDPAQTEKTVRLTIETFQRRFSLQRGNGDQGEME